MISYGSLFDKISALPVIDTHEHLPPEKQIVEQVPDFFDMLTPYICDDLLSAGMSLHEFSVIRNHDCDFAIRWQTFDRYLKDVQHTRYFRVLMDSLSFLGFDKKFDRLDMTTAALISKNISNDCQNGIYSKIARDNNIVSINVLLNGYRTNNEHFLDANEANISDRDKKKLLKIIPTISSFCPVNQSDLQCLQNDFNLPAERLSDLDDMLDQVFIEYNNSKISIIKIGSGYVRSLDFCHPNIIEAQSVLDSLNSGLSCTRNSKQLDPKIVDFQKVLPLDNYLTWSIVKRAREYRMDIQIHTGMHAWNYNLPSRCRSDGLATLINEFSNVRFILLHGGLPYLDDVLLLAKYYPNTLLNLSWVPIIDKYKATELYERALDYLPLNKVQGFGGDYYYPHCIPGHLKAARQILTDVLYKKIETCEISTDQSIEIAYKWLFENCLDKE